MRAAFFDLDGTLLNTLADIAGACNEILKTNGYAVHPEDQYRQMVGNGFDALMRRAVAPEPLPKNMDDLVAAAKKYYAAHMTEATAPYAGMSAALEELAQRGVALAVFSNKPQELSVQLVKHYFPQIAFRFVVGARPDHPLKPDPSVLLELIGELGAARENCFYVGDSDVDIFTAKNAGVHSAGAAWGFRGAAELREAGAELILSRPDELCELFGKAD